MTDKENATVADTAVKTVKEPKIVVPKEPSKKSQALEIFSAKIADRKEGKFASNKEFRAAVLTTIIATLGVSVASAATMYNAAKKEAEAADATVGLGRDPKKEKIKVEGAARGRPKNSKNKPKVETTAPVATETAAETSTETAEATDTTVTVATETKEPADAAA